MTDLFRLTFKGELKAGASPEAVRRQLAKLFKLDPRRLAQLFSGRRVVVKKHIDRATGEKMQRRLAQLGAVFDLEPEIESGAGASPGRLPERPHAPAAQFGMDDSADPFAESIRMLSAAEDGAIGDPAALADIKIAPESKGRLQGRGAKLGLVGLSVVIVALILLWVLYPKEIVPPEAFMQRMLRTVHAGASEEGTRPLYLSVQEFVAALNTASLKWETASEGVWRLTATGEPASGRKPVMLDMTFKAGDTAASRNDAVLTALRIDHKPRKAAAISTFAQKVGKGIYAQLPSTSLVAAVKQPDVALLRKLLVLGRDVITPEELNQALIAAAQQGTMDAVTELIKAGANPGMRDTRGHTALGRAAHSAQWEVVRELIKIPISGHAKGQALVFAVRDQNRSMAELLIRRGADVRVTDDAGNTPLMLAIATGQKEVFNSLMNRRNALDQRSKGPEPKTALGIALEQGQINMAMHLLERGASPVLPQHYGSALLRAVDLESPALVRVLSKKGVDLGDVDAAGDTALMRAVKRQQPEMVQTLLALKADPNTANATTGATALMLAAGQGHTAMVRLLLEAKADPQLRDRQQRTARDYLPQNAEDALQALFKPSQKRRPAVPASATKTQTAKDPLSKITGRYVLPKGPQQGYLSISAIQKNIITFALHTFDGSECHLEDRQMKLFYSKTYGSYWGKYTAEGCTLNFTYYWNKARRRWIFDIKSSGSCNRLCSPGGRIAGRYVKDAS